LGAVIFAFDKAVEALFDRIIAIGFAVKLAAHDAIVTACLDLIQAICNAFDWAVCGTRRWLPTAMSSTTPLPLVLALRPDRRRREERQGRGASTQQSPSFEWLGHASPLCRSAKPHP
jgi:hypothetical protein